ncbi:MAG TPA: hypothetical protein DCO89_01200 [Clostridiales bacterium]|nr:hypothetical protein [Clostridiales bacterium]
MDKNRVWLQKAQQLLEKSKGKKIILIGGASSAGKTYKCKLLKQQLESIGKKCLIVSLDNFYRPISERIVQQTLENFEQYKNNKLEITKIVQEITKKCLFDDKFSKQNCNKIAEKLKNIVNNSDIDRFIAELKYCHKNINFDEPSAINFKEIAKQIFSKDYLTLPEYSFKTSEIVGHKVISKNDYDYIIFEGIFALSPYLTNYINKNDVLTISLKSDLITMLSRRLYRDIVVDRRTRSPKQTFESFFEQVMPCYFKYIEPTLLHSNLNVNSVLTDEEILQKDYTNTYDSYNYQIIDKQCKNVKLYISCKNDKPENLIFEYSSKNGKKNEIYNLKNLLEQDNISKLLNYFKDTKYQVVKTKEKIEWNY